MADDQGQVAGEVVADRCVRARISGTVQGVGFRYATQRAAVACGARGYVKNLPDRRVEAVFEGDDSVVDEALAFVRVGPSHASVTDVETDILDLQGFSSFEILH